EGGGGRGRGRGGGGGDPDTEGPQGAAGHRPAPVPGAQRVRAVLAEGQAVPPGGDALREEGGQLPRLRPRRRHDGDAAVTQPSHFTYLVSIRPRPGCTTSSTQRRPS